MRAHRILGLAVAMILVASLAQANTIDSSTMWFEGVLTYDSGAGTYTGTIAAIAGSYYMPGGPGTTFDGADWRTPDGRLAVGGFDVYAEEGGFAYYGGALQGPIGADHDGYPASGGGWGDFWSPDVPDWTSYQLTLTDDHWYLEFKGDNLGTPMSGAMDWTTMFASEDDVGSYRGTVPADPDANNGVAAANGGGAQAWDMDWTWGADVVPLQLTGFTVDIVPVASATTGAETYRVSLRPTPEPGTLALLGLGGLGLAWFARRRRRTA